MIVQLQTTSNKFTKNVSPHLHLAKAGIQWVTLMSISLSPTKIEMCQLIKKESRKTFTLMRLRLNLNLNVVIL
jgi:hypothetical protein